MDYFSELLKKCSADKKFIFHPGCKELNLVNISFADDLFILYGASVDSMKIIKKTFDKGQVLSSVSGIPIASLPVRYLGIPLTTKQLNVILKSHVKYKIGNGETVKYLFDNWSTHGVLADVLSASIISSSNMLATVSPKLDSQKGGGSLKKSNCARITCLRGWRMRMIN
ncbi:hypothetical protein LIER_00737 [Lithospermum erythrorhizon]|uniref:Reverse transcriptase domain-containing protein n=1 Tax=Lithospermum erythrorhizon TaxID=34254 RepID=A0AAV3NMY7_LITER